MNTTTTLVAVAALALGAVASAQAGTTVISLGQSAENYVLYGQGAVSPGVGGFTNQQGAEVYNPITNTTTDSLTGLISGSSDPGLASGSYDFVTTYTGTPIGLGGSEVQSQSNPANLLYFFYSSFDPSLDMTLYLTGTPTGSHTLSLVTSGAFDGPGFSFLYASAQCTGVAVCTQNNVGLTPGSSQYGPVTISVSYATAAVPEAATWALMLAGAAAVGGALRRRRAGAMATA